MAKICFQLTLFKFNALIIWYLCDLFVEDI